MKTNNFLKNSSKLAILAVMVSLAFVSCKKEDDENDITEEDAVEAIEYSLAEDTNGMSKTTETAVIYAEDQQLYRAASSMVCGQTYTNSYSEAYSGTYYSYNYSASYSYETTCDGNDNVLSLSFGAEKSGVYDTTRMSSDDQVSLDWILTSLNSSEPNVVFNGSYERIGSQVSKVRNMNSFDSTLTYNISNLNVSKDTYRITSGTASVIFEGVSSNGNQYTFAGTVTFNGNDTVTLVLNGNTYTFNI